MKLPKSIGNLVNLKEAQLTISGNPLKSLPDSIRKVEHALDDTSKSEYNCYLKMLNIESHNVYNVVL